MRTLIFVSLVSLGGCSRDGDVQAFVKENDAVVTAVATAPDGAAATRVWQDRKSLLLEHLSGLKDIRGYQVKQESLDALTKTLTDAGMGLCTLQITHLGDADGGEAYKKICDEYTASLSK